eukprot:TRINITY_DN1183_c0_g2_i1.p1 TRINITY_DN1183_c0_g2~~TRINITY_DN1183_c0_g2_i1.p1  ORF type:complete len:781 (+),score=117.23 TRINITY_DN1183_c0_g2_i1:96-2438(+)
MPPPPSAGDIDVSERSPLKIGDGGDALQFESTEECGSPQNAGGDTVPAADGPRSPEFGEAVPADGDDPGSPDFREDDPSSPEFGDEEPTPSFSHEVHPPTEKPAASSPFPARPEDSWRLLSSVRVRGEHFVDEHNRVVQLRGVNLSGGSKVPLGCGTHVPGSLYRETPDRPISFVGRPFPVSEARSHFGRLRSWGFTLLRFIVTWEAIEHAGPYEYDMEYVRYIRTLVEIADEYGLLIYVDPHQDVWCRWTGGDGAPVWTLEKAGFDVDKLEETGAAVTHQGFKGDPAKYPKMLWPTNYFKLACQTMFTLFFGGNTYAPGMLVEDEREGSMPIQEYLQHHYVKSLSILAEALGGCRNVIGYGCMNEPSVGYIGHPNLSKFWGPLKHGVMPTAVQAMCAGDGYCVSVGKYNRFGMPVPQRREKLNPAGQSVWRDGHRCLWRELGIWGPPSKPGEQPKLMQPEYFAGANFGRDFWLPFAFKFAESVRSAAAAGGRPAQEPELIVFVELPPHDLGLSEMPNIGTQLGTVVNATHWYDNLTLFLGAYKAVVSFDVHKNRPVLGREAVHNMLKRQLADIKHWSRPRDGLFGPAGAPTLIGECGIPFNMNKGSSYKTGNWSEQVGALDSTIRALEKNLLNFTLWNYNPDHSPEWGDQWNMEDLSLFSGSDGRALSAAARPYAVAVPGTPTMSAFCRRSGEYRLVFEADGEDRSGPGRDTLIFIPGEQYPRGMTVQTSQSLVSTEFFLESACGAGSSGTANRVLRCVPPPGRTFSKGEECRVVLLRK